MITGPLHGLPETARQHQVQSPALLVLGEVAALADELHWFGAAPLHGRTTPPSPSTKTPPTTLADAA